MGINWKKATGYNIEVSSCGKARRRLSPEYAKRKNKEYHYINGTVTEYGYVRLSVKADKGHQKRVFMHRLIATTFLSKKKGKDFINHKDGNKLNNDFRNLEFCTSRENNIHARKTGLIKNKRDFTVSKDMANKICLLLESGYNYLEIKNILNLKTSSIVRRINIGLSFVGIREKYPIQKFRKNGKILNREKVVQIKNDIQSLKPKEVIKKHGLSRSTYWDIRDGRTWREIPWE